MLKAATALTSSPAEARPLSEAILGTGVFGIVGNAAVDRLNNVGREEIEL
jgi:hypothetical protein